MSVLEFYAILPNPAHSLTAPPFEKDESRSANRPFHKCHSLFKALQGSQKDSTAPPKKITWITIVINYLLFSFASFASLRLCVFSFPLQ
jgi:hypothetical protein